MENKFDIIRSLLRADRSVRRFVEPERIDTATLESLVDLTRFCASGRNLQPLRYRIVNTPEECAAIFPLLAWAGYLPEWPGPEPGERPAAYLVQCIDTELTARCLCDDGLQLQTITLGAAALGIGGCIIKSFNAAKISETLDIPTRFTPLYVLALGHPAEKVEIEPIGSDGDVRYYRTPDHIHHVPKRPLSEILIP